MLLLNVSLAAQSASRISTNTNQNTNKIISLYFYPFVINVKVILYLVWHSTMKGIASMLNKCAACTSSYQYIKEFQVGQSARKCDHFARAVFVSIREWGEERINDQQFCRSSPDSHVVNCGGRGEILRELCCPTISVWSTELQLVELNYVPMYPAGYTNTYLTGQCTRILRPDQQTHTTKEKSGVHISNSSFWHRIQSPHTINKSDNKPRRIKQFTALNFRHISWNQQLYCNPFWWKTYRVLMQWHVYNVSKEHEKNVMVNG